MNVLLILVNEEPPRRQFSPTRCPPAARTVVQRTVDTVRGRLGMKRGIIMLLGRRRRGQTKPEAFSAVMSHIVWERGGVARLEYCLSCVWAYCWSGSGPYPWVSEIMLLHWRGPGVVAVRCFRRTVVSRGSTGRKFRRIKGSMVVKRKTMAQRLRCCYLRPKLVMLSTGTKTKGLNSQPLLHRHRPLKNAMMLQRQLGRTSLCGRRLKNSRSRPRASNAS